jgi:hypothetical protein
MDNLIGGITSIVILGGVPFAAYHISRFIDRLTK